MTAKEKVTCECGNEMLNKDKSTPSWEVYDCAAVAKNPFIAGPADPGDRHGDGCTCGEVERVSLFVVGDANFKAPALLQRAIPVDECASALVAGECNAQGKNEAM